MKALLLLISCLLCLAAQAQRHGVYTDVSAALRQPDKVRVLDLRGQELAFLPDSLNNLQKVEVILLGMKLRNLWVYPPAWKYKFGLKRLPAGGYLHLQGRGGAAFYSFNHFTEAPLDFCGFSQLKMLDVSGGVPFVTGDTIASRMARCRPQVIVLGGDVPGKDLDTAFRDSQRRLYEAIKYFRQYKIK